MTEFDTAGLRVLARAADALCGDGRSTRGGLPDHAAGELVQVMRGVLEDPSLLPDGIVSCVPSYGFGKYLLHSSPAFVLFGTVTAPDFAAPVHDHGSWGLVGLYRGVEEEVRYRFDPASAKEPSLRLSEFDREEYVTGDVMVIASPPDDIHQVFNRGTRHSVSVHLFLCDPVRSGFRLYEGPDHVARHTGPLAYDRLPPVVERSAP